MSMDGDKKDVWQLEDGDLESVPVNCYRPPQSIASRPSWKVFGIGVVGLLSFAMFTHPGLNIACDVSEVGFILILQRFKPICVRCSYR